MDREGVVLEREMAQSLGCLAVHYQAYNPLFPYAAPGRGHPRARRGPSSLAHLLPAR